VIEAEIVNGNDTEDVEFLVDEQLNSITIPGSYIYEITGRQLCT